jgi:DNA topoisomerase-3
MPLNTIALQKKASTWLNMASDKTMEVAEKLYQQGVLSYPRTETDFFKVNDVNGDRPHNAAPPAVQLLPYPCALTPPSRCMCLQEGFEIMPLIQEQRAHPDWGNYAADLLDNGAFLWPGNGGHDDQVPQR